MSATITELSGNVFADLGFEPEEAVILRLFEAAARQLLVAAARLRRLQ